MKNKSSFKVFPWIIAHRGAKQRAPENTRSAFDTALKYPIDGIECDVQMSGDGVPVLYHDRTLVKINGLHRRISDFSYKELSLFDWGGWYSKDYQRERIMTLDRALQLYSGKTRLLIEIKSRKRDRSTGRSLELTARVLKLLARRVSRNDYKNIFILSFDKQVLKFASSKSHEWNYVLDLRRPISDMGKSGLYPKNLYAFCIPIRRLSSNFVDAVHKQRQRVMTYSCNLPGQVDKALNMNADVIMTDKPGWLVNNLRARGLQ